MVDFIPRITDIERSPVKSAARAIITLVLVAFGFSMFILFTNTVSFHARLYLFILIIFLAVFSFRPYMPLLLTVYILAVLIRPVQFYAGHKLFNVLDLFIVGLVLALLGDKVITGNLEWRYSRFNKYVYFFIAACLIATLRGLYVGSLPVNVFHETIYYTLYTALFFIMFNSIKERSEIRFFVWLFLVITFILCLLGMLEYIKATGYTGFLLYEVGTRVRSTLANANIYAGFLEVIIPLAICYLLIEKRRAVRVFLIALISLGYVNLLMTFSRGGFISGLISLFIILFFRVKKKVYSFIVLGITVVLILAASAYIARQLAVFNVEEIMTEGSITRRILGYTGMLQTIRENPVFGIGWGARFSYVPYGYFEPSRHHLVFFGHGNSTFFDIFVHMGLIGLLAYYVMIFYLLRNLLRQARTITDPEGAALPWGLFAGLTGLTFHLFFDGFIRWPTIGSVFWLLAGLAFANWYLYDKSSSPTVTRRPDKSLEVIKPFNERSAKPENKE